MGVQLCFNGSHVSNSRNADITPSSSGQSTDEFFYFIHKGKKFLLQHQAAQTLFIAKRQNVSIIITTDI